MPASIRLTFNFIRSVISNKASFWNEGRLYIPSHAGAIALEIGENSMRLSTRGRFAITAMIDLALRDKAYPVPLSDLALRHGISLSYLEQVFAKLRQHSLVESTRGPGGGYTLGFRGDSITVADIISAIEEVGDPQAGRKSVPVCSTRRRCGTR